MKLKFFIPVIVIVFAFASCYKARKCECYYTQYTDSTSKVLYINGNKKDSEKACKNMADSMDFCAIKN